MDQVQFALWRFRNVEGVMKYVASVNLSESTLNVKGIRIKLTYDPKQEQVVISYIDEPFRLPVTVSFKDFVKTMTELGFYELRPDKERHACSWGPTT